LKILKSILLVNKYFIALINAKYLLPPNANSAQMLVWRPTFGDPQCIIPPVWKKDIPIEDQVVRVDPLCKL
jgi:hypothetical protein